MTTETEQEMIDRRMREAMVILDAPLQALRQADYQVEVTATRDDTGRITVAIGTITFTRPIDRVNL